MLDTSRTAERTVSFVTMGCAKNEVDSEHMAARLVEAGYEVVDDPETADVVIVEAEKIVPAGEIKPEAVITPHVFVTHLYQSTNNLQKVRE